jgi:hypothetical protein
LLLQRLRIVTIKKNPSGEHNSLHFPMKYSIFETEIQNLTLPKSFYDK